MKDDDDADVAARSSTTLGRRPPLGGGRLGTYTALGAACGIVPLPWIPGAVAKRVRGALVYDLTSRHGLTLTPEARAVLLEAGGADGKRGVLSQGLTFALTRLLGRLGPLGLVAPVRTAIGTFVLGHLLQRYLESARTTRALRIEVDEAKRLRRAMDQALLYAVTTDTPPSREEERHLVDDLRAQSERVTDGFIVGAASLPGWLVRRLEAAFDDVLANARS